MKRPPPSAGEEGPAGGGSNKGKGRWGGRRRNEQRLGSGRGGGALSLAAFANAKSRNTGYNPALITYPNLLGTKGYVVVVVVVLRLIFDRGVVVRANVYEKQKEFYRNAKLIGKYKKSKKQQDHSNGPPQYQIHENEGHDAENVAKPHNKKKRTGQSLKEEYEKKRAEAEKAKEEREAIIQAKREEREKSEVRRKELREKMFKKTRSGQPVMKYRIEHLLETALGSSSK
ncbi:hypothetical protein EJB05_01305 [Eragrostis curvula]|uniref:rRNA-processing protein FYV7 n=1 Tax=Eragrostis curvula TaxID=38414 RepID=A0A5J9WP45_9POAL|nr:hypothetical protein EJB05_01305 [Eragrostis curvula]